MSLFTGVTTHYKLGGIFGLSSFLLLAPKLKEFSPPNGESPNLKTPFFIAHGHDDPVVKYEFGDMSQKYLKSLGFDVDFRSYRYSPPSSLNPLLTISVFSFSAKLTKMRRAKWSWSFCGSAGNSRFRGLHYEGAPAYVKRGSSRSLTEWCSRTVADSVCFPDCRHFFGSCIRRSDICPEQTFAQ